MKNWNEVVSIVNDMCQGTQYVELSTYLKNHTTFNEQERSEAVASLTKIQKKAKEISILVEELYDILYK